MHWSRFSLNKVRKSFARLRLGVLVRRSVQLSLGLLARGQRDPVDCLGWKKHFMSIFFPLKFLLNPELSPKASAVTACGTSLTFLSACGMVPWVWRHLNASVKDQNTLIFPVVCLTSCRDTSRHCHALKIQYLFLLIFGGQSNFETFVCWQLHPHHPPQTPSASRG